MTPKPLKEEVTDPKEIERYNKLFEEHVDKPRREREALREKEPTR